MGECFAPQYIGLERNNISQQNDKKINPIIKEFMRVVTKRVWGVWKTSQVP